MLYFIAGLLFWTLLCLCLKKVFQLDSIASTSYAVSFLHGVFICRCCEYSIYTESLWIDDFGDDVSPLQFKILSISAGYFAYDIFICLHMKEPLHIIVHHLLSFAIISTSLVTLRSGPELIICLWFAELSNSYSNLRFWFTNHKVLKGTKWSLLNNVLFCFVFIFLRFVIGPYIIYYILVQERTLMIVKAGCIAFGAINLIMVHAMFDSIKEF